MTSPQGEGPTLRALGRVVATLSALAMGVAAACLLLSFGLIGWAVLMRYVFNAAPVWVDEVVGFALVAIVLLAAAQTLRRGEHIGVDLLVTRLSAPAARWAQLWAMLAVAMVALILIVNGWGTASLARMLGLVTEGSLEWPTWWLMLLMPVGGALLLLAAVEAFWRAAVGLPPVGGGGHGGGQGVGGPGNAGSTGGADSSVPAAFDKDRA